MNKARKYILLLLTLLPLSIMAQSTADSIVILLISEVAYTQDAQRIYFAQSRSNLNPYEADRRCIADAIGISNWHGNAMETDINWRFVRCEFPSRLWPSRKVAFSSEEKLRLVERRNSRYARKRAIRMNADQSEYSLQLKLVVSIGDPVQIDGGNFLIYREFGYYKGNRTLEFYLVRKISAGWELIHLPCDIVS